MALTFCICVFPQGLGAESKNLYPFLLPVIQLSTDVSQPPHVYLLEDGLELWYGHTFHMHIQYTFISYKKKKLPEVDVYEALGDLISSLALLTTPHTHHTPTHLYYDYRSLITLPLCSPPFTDSLLCFILSLKCYCVLLRP